MELKRDNNSPQGTNGNEPRYPQDNLYNNDPYSQQDNSIFQNDRYQAGASQTGDSIDKMVEERYSQPGSTNTYNPGGNTYNPPGDNYYNPAPYSEPVVKANSSIPSWLIAVLALAVAAVVGYIIFSKGGSLFGKKYEPGSVSGTTYTSEFFGIKITTPSNFVITNSPPTADQAKEQMEKVNASMEVQITNSTKGEALNLVVANTKSRFTEDEITKGENFAKIQEMAKQEVEQNGLVVDSIKEDSMTIAGKTRHGFIMTCSYPGTAYKFGVGQYYLFEGKYLGGITVIARSESAAKKLITDNVSSN